MAWPAKDIGRRILVVFYCPLISLAAADTFLVSQDKQFVQPGGKVTFQTFSTTAGQNPPLADWDVSPIITGTMVTALNETNTLTYQAPQPAAGMCVQIAVTARRKGSK